MSKAVEQLNSHHDALRFNYQNKNGQWEQEYGVKAGELITVDLKNTSGEKLGEEIFKHADKYQQSLDIEKGDLAKFVLIETPESEKSNRLFIVIHHLAVDGVSWRILLDDLELLITELQNGASPDLGRKAVHTVSGMMRWINTERAVAYFPKKLTGKKLRTIISRYLLIKNTKGKLRQRILKYFQQNSILPKPNYF